MYTLLSTLSDAEVDYVLIGGLAVTLHGYQRVTMRSPEAMATVIDDLIRLKTGTGRTKDVLDIEELEKIKRQRAGG